MCSTLITGIASQEIFPKSYKEKEWVSYLSPEHSCERVSERRLRIGATVVFFTKMKPATIDDFVNSIIATKKPHEKIFFISVEHVKIGQFIKNEHVFYFETPTAAVKAFDVVFKTEDQDEVDTASEVLTEEEIAS